MKPPKNWPKRAVTLKLDLWGYVVCLIPDEETYLALDRYYHGSSAPMWKDPKSCEGRFIHERHPEGIDQFFVYAPNGNIGALAHELGHCVLTIMGRLGVTKIVESQEPFCYTLSHLIDQALPHVLRAGARKKAKR